MCYEKNISTKQNQTCQNPRFSEKNVNQGGTEGDQQTQSQRQKTAVCLMNRSFSFNKSDRILRRPEFLHLSETGKKIHNRQFLAVFRPGSDCFRFSGRTRLGITVTKKVGPAVVRNRIKRLCREHFRLNRHQIRNCQDINLIAKKKAANMSAEQAFSSLADIFSKISAMGHGNQESGK